jgi:hypothetical protein
MTLNCCYIFSGPIDSDTIIAKISSVEKKGCYRVMGLVLILEDSYTNGLHPIGVGSFILGPRPPPSHS